jgi:hypothetical protein
MEAVLNAEVRTLGGDEPDGTGGATIQPDAMLVAEDEGLDGRLGKKAKFEMYQCRLENRALKRATACASQQLGIRTQQYKMDLLASQAALDELKRDHQHLKTANTALEADSAKLRGSIDRLKSKNAALATESKILRNQLQKEVPRETQHGTDNNSASADPAVDHGESRTMEAIDVDGIVDGIPEYGSTCNSKWNERFREFQRSGRIEVSPTEAPRLYSWIRRQRKVYWETTTGIVSPQRWCETKISKLHQIGFDWGQSNVAWFEQYQQLVEIHKTEGSLLGIESHSKIGSWIQIQKRRFLHKQRKRGRGKNGKKLSLVMPHFQYQLLRQIGFAKLVNLDSPPSGKGLKQSTFVASEEGIEEKRKQDYAWNEMFDALLKHGTFEVEEEGNSRLCDWIRHQRKAYWMALAGIDTCRVMSDEKLAKLDEIGFDWGKENIAWFETYSSVSDILTKQGNLVGLEDHTVLGPWLAEQLSHLGKTRQGDLQNMNLPTGCGWISEYRSALLRQIGLLHDDQT